MEGHEELRKEVGYGGSVVVPQVLENVQVLSSNNLREIPHYYLQNEAETDPVEVEDSFHMPVIDMSKLLDKDPSIYDHELTRLHSACKDWGFFQVKSTA